MAGNTVVCKPSDRNPLSNLLLAELFDVLPPGVVNVITGDGSVGRALVAHRDVRVVAFTGSTAVGRSIAATAGQHLKKAVLELGGIDPLIVFEDADLGVAVPGAAWARLLNAGQVCTSSKRFYVVEPIADEFVRRTVEYVRTLRLGDPMLPETDIGPLISAEAVTTLERQLERLGAEGAQVLLGGRRASPCGLRGHFFEPTVVTGVRHGGIATTEEIFGPVICILRARDADEAIRLANDSEYGLGAVVYTGRLDLAMKAMEGIKAGTFWVNDPLTDNDAGPFGGMRASGLGRELGEQGLDEFRETKHVHLDYVMERKSFWFPYRERPIPPEPH
jgi:betaine-aldehyde dehydrogenase